MTVQKDSKTFFSRWENGSATRRKLKTWAYLRLRLARRCVDLALLALALVGTKYARKSTQVFHRLATEPKSTQVEWRPFVVISTLSQRNTALKWFLCDFQVLARKLASLFSHQKQVFTQIVLASPFGQGLKIKHWISSGIDLYRTQVPFTREH